MDYIAVGLAGFFGAITRALLSNINLYKDTHFPFNTLFINLSGSLILCFFLTIALERLEIDTNLRLAFSTGFLGAYTTYSTFTFETVNLLKSGDISIALLYIVATIFGGLVFAWFGLALARYITNYNTENREPQKME